tara:strand:+ start:400 stop:948 length:549 start_codon:yes stop_codon:yes gene_type:complete
MPELISYNDFLEGAYRGDINAMKGLKEEALRLKKARNSYGEARNQGKEGMHLVQQVVKNRANSGGKWNWPTDEYDVMSAPAFSAWRTTDPNYKKMMALNRGSDDPQFRQSYEVAGEEFPSNLSKFKDADHYYAPKGVAKAPAWTSADGMRHLGDHGGHKFYTTKPAPKPIPGMVTGQKPQSR